MDQSIGETWRPIPGWEGLYEVSDHGRVKSLSRVVPHGKGGPRRVRERILSSRAADGYPEVCLYREGVKTKRRVHMLVLEAFVGPRPQWAEACHADDNKQNNRLGNLRWDTHGRNMNDMSLNGTASRGETHTFSKLTEEDVRGIRAEYKRYSHSRSNTIELASRYGVARNTILDVVRRTRWKHLD
jgi:hypothetical protein